MDHQWGDFSPVRVGWDWMSLQFDDRSELMMSLVWDPVNRQPFATYGTYVVPDATLRYLDGAGITLTATGSWTSPTTGVQYPMGWELEVTSLALKLMLKPVQQQAEFGSSRYVPAAYWEGAVSVVGVKEGSAVTGKGFVELVGYDPGHASSSFTGVGQ
jgi:predicted secreted hydrolase